MNKALRTIVRAPETITVVLLIAAFAVSAIITPEFRDARYLLRQTPDYAEIGVMALTMTLVIVAGHIDLSVASGMALVACLCGKLYSAGASMGLLMPLALVFGMTLGLFNGVLIAFLRLPSLVVTLGTLALYRGLAQVLVGDKGIGSFPLWFRGWDRIFVLAVIPAPLVLLVVLAGIVALVLHKTTLGRKVYAVGTNEAAARFSGIRTNRVVLTIFILSGLAMGLGAVLSMSRLRVAQYKIGMGDELAVITAVVLGGTSIFGGRGTIFGTIAAWLLIFALRVGMELREVASQKQMAVTGTILVMSVILANLSAKLGAGRKPPSAKAQPVPQGAGAPP